MYKAIKIPLNLDGETKQILDGQSKICNWLYNHLLNDIFIVMKEYETNKNKAKKSIFNKRNLRDKIPELRNEFPFINSVYSSCLKNTAFRLGKAWKAYFEKSVEGKPHFRSFKKKWFSLLYEDKYVGYKFVNDSIEVSLGKDINGNRMHVRLPLSNSKIKELQKQNVKTFEVIKNKKRFYAVFVVEKPLPDKKSIKTLIAFDPNHKNLAYGSDNNGKAIKIDNLYFIKNLDKQIDQLKSRRDKCNKKVSRGENKFSPSRQWNFFNEKILDLYRTRREQINSGLGCFANKIIENYDAIAFGNYVPNAIHCDSKVKQHNINKKIINQCQIGQFRKVLAYKATKYGKTFFIIQESFSTKTCSCCSFVNKKLTLEEREWKCSKCGTFHIRDENASINLRSRVNDRLFGSNHPQSILKKIDCRCFWQFNGRKIVETISSTIDDTKELNSILIGIQPSA